jgi:hypothetical protein
MQFNWFNQILDEVICYNGLKVCQANATRTLLGSIAQIICSLVMSMMEALNLLFGCNHINMNQK